MFHFVVIPYAKPYHWKSSTTVYRIQESSSNLCKITSLNLHTYRDFVISVKSLYISIQVLLSDHIKCP